MRAITVRQPWAWAIMHGGKDVENRSRNIAGSYRGPVAVTAGLQIDRGYDTALISRAVGEVSRAHGSGLRYVAQRAGEPLTPGNEVTERFGSLGAILGVVDLVDVHVCRGSTDEAYGGCTPWADYAANYHLVLANPRPLQAPIPVRGRLGLWTLPDDVAAQVEEALS
jgi:hypothetical protein